MVYYRSCKALREKYIEIEALNIVLQYISTVF